MIVPFKNLGEGCWWVLGGCDSETQFFFFYESDNFHWERTKEYKDIENNKPTKSKPSTKRATNFVRCYEGNICSYLRQWVIQKHVFGSCQNVERGSLDF